MNSEKIVSSIDNFNTCIEEISKFADLYARLTSGKFVEYEDLARFENFWFGNDYIIAIKIDSNSLIISTRETVYDDLEYRTYNIPLEVFDMTEDELGEKILAYDKKVTEETEKAKKEAETKAREEEAESLKRIEQQEYKEYCRLKEKFEGNSKPSDAKYIIDCVKNGSLPDLNRPNKAGLETTIIKP